MNEDAPIIQEDIVDVDDELRLAAFDLKNAMDQLDTVLNDELVGLIERVNNRIFDVNQIIKELEEGQ